MSVKVRYHLIDTIRCMMKRVRMDPKKLPKQDEVVETSVGKLVKITDENRE